MKLPLEFLELRHNLSNYDFDIEPHYRMDENEALKVVKAIDKVGENKSCEDVSLYENAIGVITNTLQSDEEKYTGEVDKALFVIQKLVENIASNN